MTIPASLAPPPPQAPDPRRRWTRFGYRLGGGMFAVGFMLFVAAGIGVGVGVWGMMQTEHFVAPGSLAFETSRPGDYRIYHEYESFMDGRIFSTEGRIDALSFVVNAPDGTSVTVRSPSTQATYRNTTGAYPRSGYAVATFHVAAPGAYTVTAEYADAEGPEAVIRVGPGFNVGVRGWTTAVWVSGALGVGLEMTGAAVFVLTAIIGRTRETFSDGPIPAIYEEPRQ